MNTAKAIRKFLIYCFIIVALAVCFCVWPSFGANLKSNLNSSTNFFGKLVKFEVEDISLLRSQDQKPERAQPVIDNGKIWIISSRKKLVSFNMTGKKETELKIKFAPLSTPAIRGQYLYVGGDDGRFHCLALDGGSEIWNFDAKSIDFSVPLATDASIVFQTANDRIVALDQVNGQWRWEYQHVRPENLSLQGLGKPFARDGSIYIGLAGGAVAAFEEETGKLLWKNSVFRSEQFSDIDAPLTIDDSNIYAVSAYGKVAALSRRTGKVFWTYDAGGLAGSVLEGSTLFVVADQGEAIALNTLTGQKKWGVEFSKGKSSGAFYNFPTTPGIINQYLITVTRNGRVVAFDKNSGAIFYDHSYHTDTTSAAEFFSNGFIVIDNRGIARLWQM